MEHNFFNPDNEIKHASFMFKVNYHMINTDSQICIY